MRQRSRKLREARLALGRAIAELDARTQARAMAGHNGADTYGLVCVEDAARTLSRLVLTTQEVDLVTGYELRRHRELGLVLDPDPAATVRARIDRLTSAKLDELDEDPARYPTSTSTATATPRPVPFPPPDVDLTGAVEVADRLAEAVELGRRRELADEQDPPELGDAEIGTSTWTPASASTLDAGGELAEDTRIELVAGTPSQHDNRRSARVLYTGGMFKAAMGDVEARDLEWYVLSARHGLVEPGDVNHPYDDTLERMSKEGRVKWGVQVVEALKARDLVRPGVAVEVHATKLYADQLYELLADAGVQVYEIGLGLKYAGRAKLYRTRKAEAAEAPDAG